MDVLVPDDFTPTNIIINWAFNHSIFIVIPVIRGNQLTKPSKMKNLMKKIKT